MLTLMWDEIREQPLVLERCIEKNRAALQSIIDAVSSKSIYSIIIAARGTSDHAAVYGKYILELLTGIPVSLAAPSVFTLYNGRIKMENCLVMGVSQSGKAEDVLEVIRAANSQGAVTVSITNFDDSPLAVESKHHLFCDSGLERSVAATKTFTSQMYLLANLAAEWSGNSDFKEELSTVTQGMRATLGLADGVRKAVERYRFMEECFVLARGINYAIALESALKIQETTYVRAKAYATSDFHHGPFAMVERGMPIIVYAPDGPSSDDMKEMLLKLKKVEADLLVISDRPDLVELADCSLILPCTASDFVSPFYNVMLAQMFACQLALLKGLNPDSPRGLNKVTITR